MLLSRDLGRGFNAGLGAVHQPVECMDIKMVLPRSFSSFSTSKEAEMEAVGLESLRVQRLKVGEENTRGGEKDSLHKDQLCVELWFFYLFSTVPRPFQNISNTNLDNAV